jgi:hypothetical protein
LIDLKGKMGVIESGAPEASPLPCTQYFERPLDRASWLPRNELQVLAGRKRLTLPEKHQVTRDDLPSPATSTRGTESSDQTSRHEREGL